LDGPFPKLCPAVALSHQDGRHSAVALLLKAALIQVSDLKNIQIKTIIWDIYNNNIKLSLRRGYKGDLHVCKMPYSKENL
jgi:hypothetical protein